MSRRKDAATEIAAEACAGVAVLGFLAMVAGSIGSIWSYNWVLFMKIGLTGLILMCVFSAIADALHEEQ